MEVTNGAFDIREVFDVVRSSEAPVLILKVPSQEIVAASAGAHELLADNGEAVVGRELREFTEAEASDAMSLLGAGRITGYESVQTLKRTGERRRFWIRTVQDAARAVAIAVLLKEDAAGRAFVPWEDDGSPSPVIGSTDAALLIDRISSDVFDSFGYRPQEIIGSSFLALVAPEDLPDVLSALGGAARHKEGLTLRVGVVSADRGVVTSQLVLLPLTPAPSCAFALLTEDAEGSADAQAIADVITRLGRGIRGALTSHAVASTTLRSDVDLGRLSSRELEIVALLMAGDRVSAIAKLLFLSEGTIRNHLSSVFGKLAVGTQQELIELLRAPAHSVRAL
ncbi:LuxR C-terminal-related transcriptional regulator [uncultured Jatrophihabitans sp.]|uniref:helix-turn-helix transcriptional regulator n=1 Tax=uncultured Jatrophihabitans sp. TaxID=1610747 RepID=UPI0035CA0016